MTITYAMTAIVLMIGLTLMLIDVSRKLETSTHHKISVILICTTIFYVASDCLWIILYTAETFNRSLFVIVNLLFYLVYITLPYIWFLFAKHFSNSKLNSRKWNLLFALPWLFNLVLVILTVLGTGTLWIIGDDTNRYTRGPLFSLFSNLNLIYYFIPVIVILYLIFTRTKEERRTLYTTLGFSMIPALGVFIYTRFISVDAIYPFQPCCFFIGVMFAYIMLLSRVYKDAENENIRLTEEAKAANRLAELMGSVGALLTNMPAMSFSKDAKTGVYLACNQSFAEYAHKDSPEGVIGLTDKEIFDPVTAKHFIEDDKKALAMDEPYVFFEDVPDAVGVMRNLQTTKLKFNDSSGRECLLGMCVDVTELSHAKQAETEARVKQQELEEKLALHEQLIEQESKHKQQLQLITALASDYWSVYYLELDKNEGECYQSHSGITDGFKVGDRFNYLEAVTAYANRYIIEPYREEFLRFIQPDNIRKGLKNQRVISYTYMVKRGDSETYEMVKFAGVRHPEDRDDHLVHAVSACFSDVDSETRKSLEHAQALDDALAAAENASKAKTTFLSNMSHEIRTPMNAIIGLNNIAMHDEEVNNKAKEYFGKIDTSARHLLSIINDILDMSRIESGKMVINKEEFSFSKMLEQVNTIISGQCRDKGLHYECRINGKIDDYYIGDDMKLRQVLINILGNAVKFTPAGGAVTFTIDEGARFDRKATLRFTINDTGIGMSKDYLPHIFDAFSQENTSAANSLGSTGLGLPITKNIVELMNGNIEVQSEKGKGSTFIVTVTLGESDRSASGEDALQQIDPHQMKVLVIDDDPIACEHARITLGKIGIGCEVETSALKAIDTIRLHHTRREDFNLILVDWKMPELDGVETTRQIRQIVGDSTPIIILTSYHWDDIIDEAKQAGVDSFVAKPLFAGNVLDEFQEAFKAKNEILLAAKADLKGRRVLLAEDVTINAEIMLMILASREIQADLAENGQLALDKFKEHEEGYYDAILMDMRMPVMDGLEATRQIRALDRQDAKEIPIIALTANAFDEDVQRSLQAGLNAHLSKPVDAQALFSTLESLIRY